MRSQAARKLLALALSAAASAAGAAVLGAAAAPTPAAVPAALSSPAGAAQPSSVVAAALAAAAPSPVPPTPLPAPAAGAPHAPGRVHGTFVVLTAAAQAPQPSVRLEWRAAEAGDWLIRGYRVYRWRAGEGPQPRGPKDALVEGLSLDDPAEIGSDYNYVVEAVDVKGHAGPRSEPSVVDLSALPADRLAPRTPEGVTATSQRNGLTLAWRPAPAWVAPVTAYLLYRAESPAGLAGAEPLRLTGTSWSESPPAQGKDYWFAVASLDAGGRRSALSLTVSARATGTLAPGAPRDLTATSKTEKVTLNWSPAPEGTAPLSSYLLLRREADSEEWKRLAELPAKRSDYTDKAGGDQGWVYSLAAVDLEGNTGPAAFVGASPSAKILNKTLVVVMPTAYANNKDHDRGLNENVLFDFYVGSLYESYLNPVTKQQKSGQFQPLQVGTVTTDTKLALLDDRGLIPGIAVGLYLSALINFGQPTGAQTVGFSSTSGGIATLGNVYAVMSKRFWPGEPRASIHGGLLIGGLADTLGESPTPEDWRLTVRHLMPGGDYPTLFSRFVDPKIGASVAQAPHMAFGGIQFPFTVPLGFTRWHTGIRAELMMPLGMKAEYPRTLTTVPAEDPATQLPWLLNLHIDNLPLFGFEFGYFQYPGGFQLIAFYHIPDLTWSW